MIYNNSGGESIRRPRPDSYSTDPRNPGSAGMPGANPGSRDPGQRQTGGDPEDKKGAPGPISPAETPTPVLEASRSLFEEPGDALAKKQDQDALDRWSLDGGSS